MTTTIITIWHAFCDTDEGGNGMHAALSERAAQDWLLEQFGAEREEFDAFMRTGLRTGPDGETFVDEKPTPVEHRDLNEFIRCAKADGCDNWGLAATELPVPGLAQPPRIVIGVDGGIVQGVSSDVPVDVVVVDYDTDGADDVVDVPQTDGTTEEAMTSEYAADVDVAWVNDVIAALNAADEEGSN